MTPGVSNVVRLTDGAARMLVAKARVGKVSVTGSTAVGRRIAPARGNPGGPICAEPREAGFALPFGGVKMAVSARRGA